MRVFSFYMSSVWIFWKIFSQLCLNLALLMDIIITIPKRLFIIYKSLVHHDFQVMSANITYLFLELLFITLYAPSPTGIQNIGIFLKGIVKYITYQHWCSREEKCTTFKNLGLPVTQEVFFLLHESF